MGRGALRVIVRILGEGQYDLEGDSLHKLKRADERLFHAIVDDDDAEYHARFAEVVALIRGEGRPVPVEKLVESDLILPSADTSLAEARKLFSDHPS